jgi:signal transduction histidine kinase/DNA-binding response OmpR family regulator
MSYLKLYQSHNLFSFIRRLLLWPFMIRAADRQIKEANAILHLQVKELEEAITMLDRQVATLKTALATRDRLFANVSHEFRTPLTLIQGPIEKMLMHESREGVQQEYQRVLQNTRRLMTLVNQLLDLSKLDSGEMELHLKNGNLGELVCAVAFLFESLAAQKGIRFTLVKPDIPINGCFDPDCVEKIVTNLLFNAMKFTEPGGEVIVNINPICKDTSTLPFGDQIAELTEGVDIIVADTGIGIPATELERIFDRFYQLDKSNTRKYDGTGLGLSLTKELVDLHKGEITVTSEPGKGSTFSVVLPLRKELYKPEEIDIKGASVDVLNNTIEVIKESLRPDYKEEAESDESTPLILIVEDNPEMRTYMRTYLENRYRICEAVNGIDGMEQAIKTIPDLIISDVMMPNASGFEFCSTIKTDERTSHIPVVLLTAKASSESKLEGLETGADDYILKPFDAREFQLRVKNLIDRRQKLWTYFQKSLSIKPQEIVISSTDKRFLLRASDVVESHISDPTFSVDSFAGKMFFSRMQLHRKLRSLTGHSPGKFIRIIRLERAKKLLLNRDGTIAQIACQVGYNEPSHFTAAFRNHFGISPSEYVNHPKK